MLIYAVLLVGCSSLNRWNSIRQEEARQKRIEDQRFERLGQIIQDARDSRSESSDYPDPILKIMII